MRIIQLPECQGKESCQIQEGNRIKPNDDFTGEILWVCTSTFATASDCYGITNLDILFAFSSTVNTTVVSPLLNASGI